MKNSHFPHHRANDVLLYRSLNDGITSWMNVVFQSGSTRWKKYKSILPSDEFWNVIDILRSNWSMAYCAFRTESKLCNARRWDQHLKIERVLFTTQVTSVQTCRCQLSLKTALFLCSGRMGFAILFKKVKCFTHSTNFNKS